MSKKVGIPIIIAAAIGLIVLLAFMGKTFMSGPEAVKTAPPSFIDPVTGKPKGQMSGSGQTNDAKSSGGGGPEMSAGRMGGLPGR